MAKKTQYQDAIAALRIVASYSKDKGSKAKIKADIQELTTVSKYSGRRKAIYETLQDEITQNPSAKPSVKLSTATERINKNLKGKPTKKGVLSFLGKFYPVVGRNLKELDLLLLTETSEIQWFLFSETIKYIDGGLTQTQYKDAKNIASGTGSTGAFQQPDKKGNRYTSSLVHLISGDVIKVISNNVDLARKSISVFDRSELDAYHEDMKLLLIQKQSPISIFEYREVNFITGTNNVVVTYYLNDSALPHSEFSVGEPEPVTPPVKPAGQPEIPFPEKPVGEIQKLIELEQAKQRTAQLQLEAAQAMKVVMDEKVKLIKDLISVGMTMKEARKYLKID